MRKKTAKATRPEIQPISMEDFQKREALKPCPLCQGNPEYQLGITCTQCGLRLTPKIGDTWDTMRDKWNERPQEESIIEDFDNRAETIRELLEDVLNLKMMMETEKETLPDVSDILSTIDEGIRHADLEGVEDCVKDELHEARFLVVTKSNAIKDRYTTNLETLNDIVSTLREEVTTYSEMYE